MRLRFKSVFALLFLFILSVAIGEEGKEAKDTGKPSALGVRQARVEQKMDEIGFRFKELLQKLEENEPERAKRLKLALDRAGELNMKNRLKQITILLNDDALDVASEEQHEVLGDIRELIRLLLEDQDRNNEIAILEQIRRELQNAIKDQKTQKREADKVANKEKTLSDLDAQIRAVRELIEKQANVNAGIGAARKSGPQAARKVADDQHKVRKETEQVAKAIGKAGGQGEGSESKGSEGASKGSEGGSKGSEGGSKGSEGGSKGSEGGSKGSEGGSKGSEGGSQGSPSGSDQPKEPGQRQLENASKHQQNAENNLQDGKNSSAADEGKEAEDDLKAALADLEKERRRIASLPPEAFDKMADKQDKTADKVAKIEKAMEKQGGGSGKGSGTKSSSGGGKPGQKQVQQAQKNMKQASGDLRKQDPEGAARQQDEAIRQLEKALREIEERLAQLREETQEEKLARLEARFVEMLARQEIVSLETKTMDQKKLDNGVLRRTDRLAIAKLAVDERELAEMAQQALDILIEDATSVVFPAIVEGLRDDLVRVAELLETQETGDYTQYLQSEVETTLEELIDALKKLQKQKKEGGGGGGGGSCEPPLLPNSAELKLLKSAQLRVNRRTKAFDINRPEGTLDEVFTKEVKDIGLRQLEIALMTEQIIERSMIAPLK